MTESSSGIDVVFSRRLRLNLFQRNALHRFPIDWIRVGTAREPSSRWARTQCLHLRITGKHLHFDFRGKSGKHHIIDLDDACLAHVVRQSQDLPGQILFQYLDEAGRKQRVKSQDINAYLHDLAGPGFSAKDFRTWAGTLLTAVSLRELGRFDSKNQAKKNLVVAIEKVAQRLGNTPAICRKCYIHPVILDAYSRGETIAAIPVNGATVTRDRWRLSEDETLVVTFLKNQLARPKRSIRNLLRRTLRKTKTQSKP